MYDIEREKKILEILEERGTIGVNKLASIVYCSGSTIRRDLTRLEKKGLIKRTFGAVCLASTVATDETSFSTRENDNISIKKKLSKEAANQLKSSQTVFIDSSTTLFNIVKYLNSFKNLLIVTNGLKIAAEIVYRTSHKVIIVGGEIIPNSNSSLGSAAVSQLSSFHFDVCLLSCTGVSKEFGFSEASYDSAQLKKEALKNSTIKIVVFDESKFGVNKAFQTCKIENVDIVIIPNDVKQDIVDTLESTGVKVVKADSSI